MSTLNFSEQDLAGNNQLYRDTIEELHTRFGFDFTALGLTAHLGAPLKWVYGSGATSDRYRRIVLSPGHGIGGIVIKSGKPMMFLDIDKQIDPREYSSYPIVFAEDLQSFCALPLLKGERVVGSLLCAHRSVDTHHEQSYESLISELKGTLLGLTVRSDDFMYFDTSFEERERAQEIESSALPSSISVIIMAQEDERRRISRELHDGVTQELLSVSFLARQLLANCDDLEAKRQLSDLHTKTENLMDAIHNLSVELRPSTLDHFGISAALKSQSQVFEKTYGAKIYFRDNLDEKRYDGNFEAQVYRICQEAILNACKHSDCDVIIVSLDADETYLHIDIEDAGKGIEASRSKGKRRGCGLTGIQERASLINATVNVESSEDGTKVSLQAPLLAKGLA